MTGVTSNNITSLTLDITPNDVFDENNMPTSLIVIQMADSDNTINHIIDSAIGYDQGEYLIGIILPTSKQIRFMASSRSDYFTANLEEGNSPTAE